VKVEETMERMSYVSLALVLAAGSALGCHRAEPAAPPARAVRLQRIASPGGSAELRYSASVQAHEQVPLAFKVGGYVREVARREGVDGRTRPLQQGDFVREGAALARVGDEETQQRVARARAQRAGAAATLIRARADADRAQKLYDAQSLTRVEYDAAQAGLAVASANLAAAEADLESAAIGLRDSVLRAPKDALVLSRSVEAGTLASPGTVAFVLADVNRMKAIFGVPERVARALEVGQPLELELESSAEPVQGRITAVAPSADPLSRVFAVEVGIANPDRRIRAGTIATARVPSRGQPEVAAAAVPLAAVVRSPARRDGYAVFVVLDEGGRSVARAREVELGPIAGNLVHVSSGLDRGEQVVVVGASLLADGEQVNVLQ
jgi:RND family efflux transporter MFP subunit